MKKILIVSGLSLLFVGLIVASGFAENAVLEEQQAQDGYWQGTEQYRAWQQYKVDHPEEFYPEHNFEASSTESHG